MPILDIRTIDYLGFVWLLLCWGGYALVTGGRIGRTLGLNQHLRVLRTEWGRQLIARENRIVDAALVGHTIHSVTFFASTTMLVIVGLIGMLGGIERIQDVFGRYGFAVHTTRELFELKLMLEVVIFTTAFLNFTWAVRQYNYCVALVGSSPPPGAPEDVREATAAEFAMAMTLAGESFNGGMRAYYYALAVLGWFIQPWLFPVTTTLVTAILLRRQFLSRTAAVLARQAATVETSRRDG